MSYHYSREKRAGAEAMKLSYQTARKRTEQAAGEEEEARAKWLEADRLATLAEVQEAAEAEEEKSQS